MILYTIGFTQKSLRAFIGLLRAARVDGIVDIRRNNVSQLAGYAKRDDLAYVLELCGIGYQEEKRLAPSTELLDRYHRDHDWSAYEPAFTAELAERDVPAVLADIEARFQHPCLLCAEPEPSHCHRRLVAEAFVRLRPDLPVRHLVLERASQPQARKPARPRRAARAARAVASQPEPEATL